MPVNSAVVVHWILMLSFMRTVLMLNITWTSVLHVQLSVVYIYYLANVAVSNMWAKRGIVSEKDLMVIEDIYEEVQRHTSCTITFAVPRVMVFRV